MLKIHITLIIIQIIVIVENIKISESETSINSSISSQEREEQIPTFWELQQIFLAEENALNYLIKNKVLNIERR